eukprot:TRINITY_DN3038_c0_g1_i4.p1 TRINITY_DN3038_c0_g1~~TRINITY_DN3038_c0_g1_i4.p1  ORF type:complete len:260 (+),score=38.75 TRINITY_DN3038_c0_g1_i4:88-867(+)
MLTLMVSLSAAVLALFTVSLAFLPSQHAAVAPRSLLSVAAQPTTTCRHTVDGGQWRADDRGGLCEWSALELMSGCCPAPTASDSCDACADGCCAHYAACVACCQQEPEPPAAEFAEFVPSSDRFELCRSVCRTTSASVKRIGAQRSSVSVCVCVVLAMVSDNAGNSLQQPTNTVSLAATMAVEILTALCAKKPLLSTTKPVLRRRHVSQSPRLPVQSSPLLCSCCQALLWILNEAVVWFFVLAIKTLIYLYNIFGPTRD